MHGGKTPRGISKQNGGGRYAQLLPAKLLQRYLNAEHDPDRLSLAADIALVDTRIADLLALLHAEPGESVKPAAVDRVWADILELLRDRKGLVDAEQRRMAANRETLPIQQAMMTIGAMASAMRQAVIAEIGDGPESRAILGRVAREMQRMLGDYAIPGSVAS